MPNKKKRIELEQGTGLSEGKYIVRRLVDTVGYEIGQELTKEEVGGLCDNPDWMVTVTKSR